MEAIDLKSQQKLIQEKLNQRLATVFEHNKYIMGPEVYELEEAMTRLVGSRYAISCSSGTTALEMALMALDLDHGDIVFTTPFTFVATASMVYHLGLIPVFIDIDPKTWNIDPVCLEITLKALERVNSSKKVNEAKLVPRAVIAVDIFGLPADYKGLRRVADNYNLVIIEDACQSIGSSVDSKMAGSIGDISCTSFFPTKPLGCYGDGGMVFTNRKEWAEKLELIRNHGIGKERYNSEVLGLNGRLDTIQAAILMAKLETGIFTMELIQRQCAANYYNHALEKTCLQLQHIPHGSISAWAQYSVVVPTTDFRDDLESKFSKEGIPYQIYYPTPLYKQGLFSQFKHGNCNCMSAEFLCNRIISLPFHPYISKKDQDKVIAAIDWCFKHQSYK